MLDVADCAANGSGDLPVAKSLRSRIANLTNLFLRETGCRMGFASVLATFARFVVHVACLGVNPEVMGIYASGIVATVTHNRFGQKLFAIMELPSESMGAICAPAIGQFPIAIGVDIARPFPAFVEVFGLKSRTKTFLEGCSKLIAATSFLFLGWGASMIVHVEKFLSAFGQSLGLLAQSPGTFYWFYQSILAHLAYGHNQLQGA